MKRHKSAHLIVFRSIDEVGIKMDWVGKRAHPQGHARPCLRIWDGNNKTCYSDPRAFLNFETKQESKDYGIDYLHLSPF